MSEVCESRRTVREGPTAEDEEEEEEEEGGGGCCGGLQQHDSEGRGQRREEGSSGCEWEQQVM
jgi:hypothetical protein